MTKTAGIGKQNQKTGLEILAVFLILLATGNASAQSITPTQSDEIIIDKGQSGKADPGDTIRYTVTVTNTVAPDATNVQLTVTNPPDLAGLTALIGGSFRTSPLALPDGPYNCIGNVGISVPDGGSDLLANDFDDSIAGLTVTAVTNASTTGGGQITIFTNGSFNYMPAPGFEGTDTYTYTLNDGNGVGGPVPNTDMGVVSILVSEVIWFVDENAGSNGDGRLNSPFSTLANFVSDAVDETGDIIFLYEDATSYAGGIILLDNQKLIGQDATVSLASAAGLTVPTHSNLLPATNSGNGTFATITNSSGAGIQLGMNNTIRGLTVGTTATGEYAIRDNAASVGNLTISDAAINNTLGAFRASAGGALNVTFNSITATTGGSVNGIFLVNATGTFNGGTGSMSNMTGSPILISGGTVALDYDGSLTKTSVGRLVDIQTHGTGAITIDGILSSTGSSTGILLNGNTSGTISFTSGTKTFNTGGSNAITLSSNTGATINFTGGGLVITTTSGTGFNATGGATAVTVQGTGNTINSTTGTALNVMSTTIGASGLTFQSISKNGGTNGIVLNTTGSSGGLTVTGDGGGSNNGSGGTIQNTTGVAVSLTSTRDINLGYMNITNAGDDGIRGQGVTNFALNRSNLINNGNATAENGIQFGEASGTVPGLFGTASITNTVVSGSAGNNVHIRNTTGTLNALTVSNSSFNNLNDVTGANSFLFEMSGTAITTAATMTACTFSNNSPQRGLEVQAHDNANIQSYTVQNSTFNENGIHMSFTQDGAASSYFKVLNNTSMLNANPLQAINVFSSATSTGGTFQGRIDGNVIGNNTVAGSGSTTGGGIRMFLQGMTRGAFLINNNQIYECPAARGIEVTSGSFATNGVDATITNNTIDHIHPGYSSGADFPLAAIYLVADNTTGSGNGTLRADVRGNNVNLPGGSYDYPTFDGMAPWLYYHEEAGLGNSLLLDNPPTGAATAAAELAATNTGATGASAAVGLITSSIVIPP